MAEGSNDTHLNMLIGMCEVNIHASPVADFDMHLYNIGNRSRFLQDANVYRTHAAPHPFVISLSSTIHYKA